MEHRRAVGKMIADLGLEKFLEIVGQQCADFGHQTTNNKTPAGTPISRFEQWELIGETPIWKV